VIWWDGSPKQLRRGVLVLLQLFVKACEVGQWAVGIQCMVLVLHGRNRAASNCASDISAGSGRLNLAAVNRSR
jgi:hypothetical protein